MKKLSGGSIYLFMLFLLVGCGGSGARISSPALTIVSLAPPDGTLGASYAGTQGFNFAAKGGTPPYAWSWSAATGSTLPPGLSLSAGAGVVSGIPTTIGLYNITVSVKDSGAPATQASMPYAINVIAPQTALEISSWQLPIGTLGADYGGVAGYSFSASGGTAPYTWGWVATAGSSLPQGLALSNIGVISGIPTTEGSYSFTVTVSDSESPPAQSSTNYTIWVLQAGEVAITSGTLPTGHVGLRYGGLHSVDQWLFYGFPLGAAGGTPPYSWTWAAAPGSSLPPGLHISSLLLGGCSAGACVRVDVVDGTPTAAGTYDVVVTVTDSATPSAQGSTNYTIVIKNP